jgi:hypothetical protein
MSRASRNGLLIAAIHMLIVGGVAAKLAFDRTTRPRVWARAAPVDPDLPIRGRYVSLRLEADIGPALKLAPEPAAAPGPGRDDWIPPPQTAVALDVADGALVATAPDESSAVYARAAERDGRGVAVLDPPVACFIPEHVDDPSRRAAGEELWVEVTIPRRGPPRPIRLGVKKDGTLTPLVLN